ncbi:MAG TPA: CBS domain-containing protein [Acidimicrobiales bacterium]|nr:CBS domain-containing protein [Acidimicrobiales bacterium]
MGFGLPTEGEDGPFVGERVTEVLTLAPDDTVAHARSRLAEAGAAVAVVVAEGLAVGAVESEGLAEAGEDQRLLDVMDVVPPSVRPSATVPELAEAGADRVLVTDPDGRLLGEARIEAGEAGDEGEPNEARFLEELHDVLEAAKERFGDRDPDADELRSFLRDRLLSEGRSPEEADRFLDEMEGPDQG